MSNEEKFGTIKAQNQDIKIPWNSNLKNGSQKIIFDN